jgi:hypothetical protein
MEKLESICFVLFFISIIVNAVLILSTIYAIIWLDVEIIIYLFKIFSTCVWTATIPLYIILRIIE